MLLGPLPIFDPWFPYAKLHSECFISSFLNNPASRVVTDGKTGAHLVLQSVPQH